MFLRVLAMLMFALGLVLLLYGTFALKSSDNALLGYYISFSALVLWGVASVFIIMSRSAIDRIKIRDTKEKKSL